LSPVLVSETPELTAPVEAVLDRAFGPGRYAKVSERVRERGAQFEPALSRVAMEGHRVLGVCRIWRVAVGGADMRLMGPLAVDPDAQNAGVGAALARDAVRACRAAGAGGVLTVGAYPFFAPLGFSLVPRGRIVFPGPVDADRVLWLELRPGGLDEAAGAIAAPRV
jgi:predicted N-acetyltransferase YhbS